MVTQKEYDKLKKDYEELEKSYVKLYEAHWRQEDLNRVLKKHIDKLLEEKQ